MTYELRHGRWEHVMADVVADVLITDAPWSKTTHEGHRDGLEAYDGAGRDDLPYRHWNEHDVAAFVRSWSPRVRGWFVSLTDDVLAPAWKAALVAEDRVVLPALPFVHRGSRVRMRGDGPSSWTTQIIVARPRTREHASWGTLDGAYILPKGLDAHETEMPIIGGKPLWLLGQLIEDYSRPGDLVVDPCAGAGTTLLAAVSKGRRAIGSEAKREHFRTALSRLRQANPNTEVARG